jgi:hypothetical protein
MGALRFFDLGQIVVIGVSQADAGSISLVIVPGEIARPFLPLPTVVFSIYWASRNSVFLGGGAARGRPYFRSAASRRPGARFEGGWTKAMPGGAVQFDQTGLNTLSVPIMVQWRNKELVTVWPKAVAQASPVWHS